MLDLPGLARWLDEHHTGDLFRLETLDRYTSAGDGDECTRFLRGEPSPDPDSKHGWLSRLRRDADAGRLWRRVHVVRVPLSDYLRYECEWCYTDNVAAGEDVRILDLGEGPHVADILSRVGDFYLVDGMHAAAMTYGPTGRFQSATPVGAPLIDVYRLLARAAWDLAEPFDAWWAAHPEHHRKRAA